MKKNFNSVTIFALTCLLGVPSFAQEDAEAAVKKAEAPTELPGLEIDGRVFAENTAYAGTYSLLDSEAIELSNINDVEDLSGAVPGLHVTDTNGRSFGNVYTLRGIGNTPLFGTSGVVFYLDDVPQGDPSSINPVLTGLESIRVYRGPQGHIFGRNSSAGVVSMYSRKPGDTRETKIDLTIGEYSTREYSISTSAPLGNGASYSFSLGHSERDGYIYNSTLGKYEDDRDHTGGRFNLNFKANDVLDVNLGIAVDKFDDGSQGFVKITDLNPLTGEVTRNNNYLTSGSNTAAYLSVNRDQEWIKLSRDYAWGKLTSITSRLDWKIDPNIQDLDFGAPSAMIPMDMASTIIQAQETWTQEFRFETDNKNALSWQGGFFYLNTDIDGNGARKYPSLASYDSDTTLHQAEEKNLAAFGSFDYKYTEEINVFGGFRWDRTERNIKRNKSTLQIPYASATDPSTYILAAATPIDASSTFSQVTPSVGLSYDASETTKIFAKTAVGYKPGGYSAYTNSTNLSYKEEKAWTTEIGITLEPNTTWRMVLAAFWSDIENYQFEKSLSAFTTDYAIINAEEVGGKGFEAELVAQPNENLIISAALGINDMTFEKHGIFNGNNVPFAPRHTLNISAQYSLPSGYYGRVELRSVGETFYDEENNTALQQEKYSVVNASIGYESEGYSIQVFGRNLGDERYYSNISPVSKSAGLIGGIAGAPRIFGVSLSKKF
jgi:iron complex outermembrane receptor protein